MTSISQASAEPVSNLQNYKYSDTWVGTALEVISAQDAAKWTDDLFPFGRWPDPILRRTASSVDFRQMKRTDLENICLKLRKTARDKAAVGLAAQQW
jgi:tRNA U34 2-thiouridine synthase MnmA/TrmU